MILITVLLLLVSVATSSAFCNDGSNPCRLDDKNATNAYFMSANGYHCLDAVNGQVICTCPDELSVRDRPCRICERNPNPCGVGPSVGACTEINLSFTCLCKNAQGIFEFSPKPCDNTSVTQPPPVPNSCENGGVQDPETKVCNCPSGFVGSKCDAKIDSQLCNNIQCMNNGVCAIRPTVQGGMNYRSVCFCQLGFDGEFCQRKSTPGLCYTGLCLNGASCIQRDVGSSRHAYCVCLPGWMGQRCEQQYFVCRSPGNFVDNNMYNQGKYFTCTLGPNNIYQIEHKSCPYGLKYNSGKQLCLF